MTRWMRVAYGLRTHRLGGWSLERWGVILALGVVALLVLRWLFRGRPPTPWWHWLGAVVLAAGACVLVALGQWAAARGYVMFMPASAPLASPPAQALDPRDKVAVRATGRFEVETRAHYYAHLPAYWRSFASREHAVMAKVDPSRFLLIGRSSEEERGLWYIFIRPEAVRAVSAGRLAFGSDEKPALRVDYSRSEAVANGKKPARTVSETAYLAFEDVAARALVWGDLLADG